MKYIFTLLLLIHSMGFASPIRKANLRPDGIININTALGIATIIQLPETIQSIIIGDQSGFKVEYLDKAVTIKPLRWGAKTNLYLVTEKQRYNIRLHTDRQESADFIVYVQTPKDEATVKWKNFEKRVQTANSTFEILRVGTSKAGFLILTGRLCTQDSQTIKPEEFWVFQGSSSRTINGLYISSNKASAKTPIEFGISLSKSDLEERKSLRIELKTNSAWALEIPWEVLWK